MKMWAGRATGELDKQADDFNSSIHFDSRMYKQDITASVAHAAMLAKQGIITADDKERIVDGLSSILADIESGALKFNMDSEDIHMFVEEELTKRIGEVGKKLHTARSRNDQVATDIRLYMRDEVAGVINLLKSLLRVLAEQAEEYKAVIMPGYTHLQRAQPVTLGHHLLAYAMMFCRDIDRLKDAAARMNVSPLGACALAGTTFETDRDFTAAELGFDGITENSLDSVSDRDFLVEIMSAFSLIMLHLSRFSEEIILWSSLEFGFIELSDSYTTGSSIMPQKKNSDIAELVRGKSGRVYGDLFALLTMLKGLPLAYNKDMQEDKEAVFDSLDTVKLCLANFAPMLATMRVNQQKMYRAAGEGFINATDLADYLAKRGVPFRTAYKIVGEIVAYCIENNTVLDEVPLTKYKEFSDAFGEDLYKEINLETCVNKRVSKGGTGITSVERQIETVKQLIRGLTRTEDYF